MRGLVKWAERIERPEDVPAVMREAFRVMTSGRPGPVCVEMSWDILPQSGDMTAAEPAVPDANPTPDAAAIAEAARLLKVAQRPLILVGGGAQHASVEVRTLVERLGAPVSAFRSGRGVVTEDHPLSVTSYAASRLWKDTDLLLGIGTRLEMPYMRWADPMNAVTVAPPHPPLIRIDIDPDEMTRLVPRVGIVADAADGARALCDSLAGHAPPAQARARIDAVRAAAAAAVERVTPHVQYLRVIREVLPRDGFFVEELCQAGFTSYFAFPVYTPRTYVTPGFQGTLGFGFPTALGVKAAHPGRAVVSITGDGGFMFGVQDLATAVEHNLGVVVIVFNNGAFSNVRRDLRARYDGRAIAADFRNPDFQELAHAFGAQSWRVASPEALKPVLAEALARNAPGLIEVMVDPDTEVSPWPFIHTGLAPG